MQRTPLEYLFSFNGRSGRIAYLCMGLAWTAIFIAAALVCALIAAVLPLLNVVFLSLLLLIPAAWVSVFAVTFRRLHDLNLSGWWSLMPIALNLAAAPLYPEMPFDAAMEMAAQSPAGLVDADGFMRDGLPEDAPEVGTSNVFLLALVYIISTGFTLALALWPGKPEDNAYGPNVPLKKVE